MAQATNQIPEKYAKLKQAEAAGLVVPKSLLLNCSEAPSAIQSAIDDFILDQLDNRFIVRSAHLSEDGGDFSLAGHFWSSGPVAAEQLFATIQQAQQENASVLESLALAESSVGLLTDARISPKLILQEYIEHEIGGVLFSPWSFFPDYVYIEYSETGVKQVVEGDASVSLVLCLDGDYPDPLPLPEAHGLLRQQLVELCCQLRQIYDFPVDCEWAYEWQKQRVVVLQIRPQTHSVGPILSSDDSHSQSAFGTSSNWQFTALSESLGRLSPLSFSLLQQLYTDTIPLFKQLGCKAKLVDFIKLAPDGTVLVDPERETQFYSMTFFGGFQRGMQQAKIATEVSVKLRRYATSAPFSYEILQQLFADWMSANLLGAGAGRSGSEVVTFIEPKHAYEVSWPAVFESPTMAGNPNPESFEVLNAWGRALFLFELNKLKLILKPSAQESNDGMEASGDCRKDTKKRYLHFSTWQALHANGLTTASTESTKDYKRPNIDAYESAKDHQHKLAQLALYDYAMSSSSRGGIQTLSSTRSVEGLLQIIMNPAGVTDPMQADCILIAPYFDNRWISKLKSMKGIVVSKGSRLSHSAIVAREHGVPYYVVPELSLKALDQGQHVVLDPDTVARLFTER